MKELEKLSFLISFYIPDVHAIDNAQPINPYYYMGADKSLARPDWKNN